MSQNFSENVKFSEKKAQILRFEPENENFWNFAQLWALNPSIVSFFLKSEDFLLQISTGPAYPPKKYFDGTRCGTRGTRLS